MTAIQRLNVCFKACLPVLLGMSFVSAGFVPALAKVGVTSAVNPAAKSAAPGAKLRVISIGKTVVSNERINTDAGGLVQILLLDGSTFTVGPNSTLTIDRFVYDPGSGSAELAATFSKGAFRFVGGLASRRRGAARINTAVGTLGIRGAMVEGATDAGGDNGIVSMIFGDEVVFTSKGGKKTRIYEPGYTMEISNGGRTTKVRRRTRSDAGTFHVALAGSPGSSGGARQIPNTTSVAGSPIIEVNSGAPRHCNHTDSETAAGKIGKL